MIIELGSKMEKKEVRIKVMIMRPSWLVSILSKL